jgi:hypothetical protein
MHKVIDSVLAFSAVFLLNAAAAGSSTNTAPRWQVPTNWVEITPGPGMFAALSPAAGSARPIVVTVDCLRPGIAIHRERPPLNLPSFEMTGDSRKPIRTVVPLPDSHDRATMLDIAGMDSGTSASRRHIVIKVLRSHEEWLYRIIGDAKAVASQKDAFIKFVQSAQYSDD